MKRNKGNRNFYFVIGFIVLVLLTIFFNKGVFLQPAGNEVVVYGSNYRDVVTLEGGDDGGTRLVVSTYLPDGTVSRIPYFFNQYSKITIFLEGDNDEAIILSNVYSINNDFSVFGGQGDDLVVTVGGNDKISGGEGNDRVYSYGGGDTI